MQAENTPTGLRSCIKSLEILCEYNEGVIYQALDIVTQNENANRLIGAIRRIAADIEREIEENREDWLRDVRMEQMKNGN